MKTTTALLFALLATSTATAHAQSEPMTHDGFMLRLGLGVGYESLSLDDGFGTDVKLSGFGVGSSIALGGVVARDLAINADFFASSVFSPNWPRTVSTSARRGTRASLSTGWGSA